MRKKLILSILLILVSAALIGCAAATTGNIAVVEIQSVAALSYSHEQTASDVQIDAEQPDDEAAVVMITPQPTEKPELPAETHVNTPMPAITAEPTPEYTVDDVDSTGGYVYAGTVNLRSGPDTEYELVAEYSRGDKLNITGESGDWYRVEIGDSEGFMLKEYVRTGAMPTAAPTVKPTAKPTATPKATAEPTAAPVNANGAGSFSAADVYLAAQLISKESGKNTDGYRAVASVIYNRVMSSKFPNTVEGVVFQDGQFSPAKNEATLRAITPADEIIAAVEYVFGGNPILPADVLFFRAAKSDTSWGSRTYYGTYGGNAFYS